VDVPVRLNGICLLHLWVNTNSQVVKCRIGNYDNIQATETNQINNHITSCFDVSAIIV